jgi:hypothetical protein
VGLILLEKFHLYHQERGKVFDQREISADGNLIAGEPATKLNRVRVLDLARDPEQIKEQ